MLRLTLAVLLLAALFSAATWDAPVTAQTIPKPTATFLPPGYLTPTPYPWASPVPQATVLVDGRGMGFRPRLLWIVYVER